MIDSKEFRNMIVEFFEKKIQKNIFAQSQRYEKAAQTRELERNIGDKICKILTNSSDYKWTETESIIKDYCRKAYNTVEPEQVIKVITIQMKRIDRLNELGI